MISSSRFQISSLSVVFAFAFLAASSAYCQQDSLPTVALTHAGQTEGVDLGPASPSVTLDDLQIVLKRSPEQQQALDILLVRQHQQGDPLFQAWLTPAEFGETFGISEQDVAPIREWLQGQGFSVGSVRADEMVIDFSGSIGQVERAFNVEIHRYRAADGSIHLAAAEEQQIPKQISKSVLGFTGLNGRSRIVECNTVPEPVRDAMGRNTNQMNAAQGYGIGSPCEVPPLIHENVSGSETMLMGFTGQTGATPGGSAAYGNLIQASDGNFYGTSYLGGASGNGVVFRITSAGVYTVVHTFATATTDGANPYGGLIQGTDGNFYGTTVNGGATGYGTVFKMLATSPYTVTLLHSFSTGTTDGQHPYAGLVQGTDGNFYGTTYAGGTTGYGVVFRILAASPYTFTVMHYFSAATTDGEHPSCVLLQGTDGNFYGTTRAGGATGYGTVFKVLAASPYTLTLLHSFSSVTTDGETPFAGLMQGTDGYFYGTAEGGATKSYGMVFKMSPTSPYTLTVLHSFTGSNVDGEYPYAALVQGTDGNFYGTTDLGGPTNGGTIYEVSSGTYTVLHSFTYDTAADGYYPYAGLVQGTDGNFYGTTYSGGVDFYGTVYKLTVSPTETAPVQLSASATTLSIGQSLTMSYSVANADSGTLAGTMNQCFESNTAGDATYWDSIVNANSTTATQSVTAVAIGTFSYALTCGGIESNLVSITVSKQTPTLTMATPTAAAPVTQSPGSLAAFNVTATLSWTGSTAPTTADVAFTSTAAGTFGAVSCGTSSPATCTASFTPTASDSAGSYSSSVSFSGDSNFNSTSSSTIANDYIISKPTPTLTMTTPTTAAPVTQSAGSLAAFNVTSTLAWTGSTRPTPADVVFTSTAAGTFGTVTCGTVAPATCTSLFTPTSTDAPGNYDSSVVFSGDSNYNSTTISTMSADYTINAIAPNVAVSSVISPYGSTAAITVTASESGSDGIASGSVVTFGTAGGIGGSFSPPTCTIASGSCTVSYIPSGILALDTYANDITASFSASGNYAAAGATSNLTITESFAFSLMASFTGTSGTDIGASPSYASLIQASDGNFYGITCGGGANGQGAVFNISPGAVFTLLHSFSTAATDGECPFGALVEGTDGNFYGTSTGGGASGQGTIYEITSAGVFSLLHSFSNAATDGENPDAGLVQGTDGNFYGTTYGGGANGDGTIFKISSTAPYTFTLIHSFSTATTDGMIARGGLVQGTDGNFYGMTEVGGANGAGTVFRISPVSPYTLTVIHSFNGSDGNLPFAGLIQATDGNFYGMTNQGGANNRGAVFKISSASPYTFTLLHSFSASNASDGMSPFGNLVQSTDGSFYGMTNQGGATGYGTVFQINSSGTFSLVHSFSYNNPADGNGPYGNLVQGADGNLYGMTALGGANSDGVIFKLTGSPTELSPVQLTASATTLTVGQSFTLSYSVLNADTGTVPGTLNQCFESNTAGDTTYWSGVVDATSTTATQAVTAVAGGTFTYALTCGGVESNLITITVNQATSSLNLVAATPGSTSAGVSSTLLTATMSPTISGVVVTFTDATTGAATTATTNSAGVAATTVTGTSAGPNVYSASIVAGANNSAATSNAVTVYYAGILLSSDLTHDFSINPGTYDGSPICNGSNGTNGSTCTSGYGVVVTNFTALSQPIQLSLSNAGSPDNAFSSITNCPVSGLAAGKSCNYIFYYLPPYGDGCSLVVSCTTPAGQSGPEGTFESATWTISASGTIFGVAAGGVVSFPTTLEGKALLAAGNALTVTPTSLIFGPQAPGAVSAVKNVTVKNNSAGSIGITYAISNSKFTSNNGCAATLAAGASCQIQITYSDASAASDSGNLTITPASGRAISVTLTGTTANDTGLSLSTIAHNFGSVTDATTDTFGLSISNNSAASATISFSNTAGSGFTVANGCGATLAAGASCDYVFTFAPTSPGASVDTLVITSSVPILPGGTTSSPYTDAVTVTGTGIAGGSFTATSVAHNFGTVAVGSAATTYGVQLANNTSAAITLALGGGTFATMGAADGYSVLTNCGATLAMNSNCEVEFNYTPTAAGATQVMYPIAATNSNGSVPLMSGGVSYGGITLTGTGQ